MKKAVVFIVCLLAANITSATDQTCPEIAGRVERQSYRSQLAQTTMYYTVYLPPCYTPSQTYPTIYLMHGSASYDDHWLQLGLDEALDAGITSGELPPMVAVLPYGEWIANENQFGRVSFEAVFLDELMPAVEAQYAITTDPTRRAIGGISRGGFWAYVIGLRHPDQFAAVGGHSAFFDPNHAPPSHNPLDLALRAPGIADLGLWLDRGTDDYAAPNLDRMSANLSEAGIAHTYTVHPTGEHNNTYWREHVPAYLGFYASHITPALSQPTAPDPTAFAFTPPRPTPDPAAFVFRPPVSADGVFLFLPVVAFNSTRYSLDGGAFWNVLSGMSDADLVLDADTAALLDAYNVNVNPTRTVQRQQLEPTLWQDRNAYALLPFDALTPRYRVLQVDEQNPLFDVDDYPLAFRSDAPNFVPGRLTTLTLSGVTAITRSSIAPIDQYGVAWAASGIAPYTRQVDFFHTSNEVSFTTDCPQPAGPQLGAFCSKRDHFAIFEQVGLDIVELSGNHNNDYGYDAYLDTLTLYAENGLQTVGGGATVAAARQPLILTHGGNTIAMIACNDAGPYYAVVGAERPGAAACGPWLADTLAGLQPSVDLIVVGVQHVEFEEYEPRPEIQTDFRQIAEWGADVVVGTHAHKPQTFEFYNTGRASPTLIHYGLGNLFFDQPFWGNRRFWMDTLFVYDGALVTVELFTGIIDDQARPRPMTTDERQNFLDFMFVVHNGVR